jgi:hypothetical protein
MNSRQQAVGSRPRPRRALVFVACCLLPAAHAPAADPSFVVHSTRAELPAGPLVRLAADGTVRVGDGSAVPGNEVVALRRQGLAPPIFPHEQQYAQFVNGDRLPGTLVGIQGDKARFLADLGGPQEIAIPVSALAAIWLTESTRPRSLAEKRPQDLAQLSNGDTVAGTVIAWPKDGPLKLEAAGREVAVPRERVQALLFSTELARGRKPRTPYRLLVLINGARLSVRTAELVGEEIRATTLTGATLRIPKQALAAVNVFNGPAVYLSDLTPRRYEHTPYLGARWPLTNDQSVGGGDLRIGGGSYDKGIGLHSRSRVTYAIPAAAVRFEAVVGLDEVAGRSGNVQIQVFVDGKQLLDAPAELSAGDPPKTLRLPLPANAKELTVLVDFGRGGDVQDHVDWADARIIVGGPARR